MLPRLLVLLALTGCWVGGEVAEPELMAEVTTEAPLDSQEQVLVFDPPDYTRYIMHSKTDLLINISATLYNYASYYRDRGSSFYVGLMFDAPNTNTGAMVKVEKLSQVLYVGAKAFDLPYRIFWPLQLNNSANNASFAEAASLPVSANRVELLIDSIGYPNLTVHVIQVDANSTPSVIHERYYHLRIIRNYRTVDLGFTLTITIVALMNAFAVGCMTDLAVLRAHVKESAIPMCIAAGTQYIAVPLLAFCLMKAASVLPEFAVGVLISVCIPGSGLGHLIVVITGTANCELSLAINCLHILLTLGTAPLWLISLGQFLPNGEGQTEIPVYMIVVCLAVLLLPYSLGLLLRRFKSVMAEALLNWLVKPSLLLFMILFITLGLYINVYALGILDNLTMAMAGMIPSLGYCIGGGLTLLVRQGKPAAKSVAIEATITNSLAVIAIIKHTMPQPDADMAIAGAIAVLFFTPVPFLGLLIFHKVKKKVLTYMENKKFEKEQQETILKSFAVITQNALQISGMTPAQPTDKKAEEEVKVDNTIEESDDEDDPHTTVVQLQDDSTVETVPLTQSNHRNYL